MGRPRLWTHAKHAALMASQTEPPPSPAPLPNYVPVTDRTPIGYARRDAESTDAIMRGTIAEMQRLAAAIGHDHDAQRVAHALQQVMITAAQALALAGQVRGIQETTANFEETP